MNFTEASNKYEKFMHVHGGTRDCYYFFNCGVLAYWSGSKILKARLFESELKRDDWGEFVERETIEVGDVVRLEGIQYHGILVAHDKNNDRVCVAYGSDYFNVDYIRKLTLIRKGPKVHTFEGVMFKHYMDVDVIVATGAHGMPPERLDKLADNGETYRMELTKEG